jgi:hypothetical protein
MGLTAIKIQQILIHGLSRSPIRADFHNTLVKLQQQGAIVSSVGRTREIGGRGKAWEEMGDDIPILVPIYKAWHHRVGVCARADEEDNDEQQRLEVEYRRLLEGKGWLVCGKELMRGGNATGVNRIPF